MSRYFRIFLVCLSSAASSQAALAHESQPAALDLRKIDQTHYEVTWRAPKYYGRPHPAELKLPSHWKTVSGPTERELTDSHVVRRTVEVSTDSLEGSLIRFPGLEDTTTDVFVRTTNANGSTITSVVRPSQPAVELRGKITMAGMATDYGSLGVFHILQGVDHLLFVLGLLLIVAGRMTLVKTVTAFTVAHSISLGAATLGLASLPLPPLNAAVALSIFFLGPEVIRARRGQTSLTVRYPWIVAFFFGLLHGFGFASGLSIAGLTGYELWSALAFFNLGVELGQLAFILLALALCAAFSILNVRWPRWAQLLPGYTVGSLGAFWTIQRSYLLLGGLT